MLGDIAHDRTLQLGGNVVPSEPAARGVVAGVVAIAREVGHVDAPDKGDLIIDHDRLLVMAVHRPLPCVESALDTGGAAQPLANGANLAARRMEQRNRGSGPEENAYLDPLGQAGEQVAEHHRWFAVAHELKRGFYVPSSDMHVRVRGLESLGDALERPSAIDEHLDAVARSRRWLTGSPGERGALKRFVPAHPP